VTKTHLCTWQARVLEMLRLCAAAAPRAQPAAQAALTTASLAVRQTPPPSLLQLGSSPAALIAGPKVMSPLPKPLAPPPPPLSATASGQSTLLDRNLRFLVDELLVCILSASAPHATLSLPAASALPTPGQQPQAPAALDLAVVLFGRLCAVFAPYEWPLLEDCIARMASVLPCDSGCFPSAETLQTLASQRLSAPREGL
jgi:hypothetical protein